MLTSVQMLAHYYTLVMKTDNVQTQIQDTTAHVMSATRSNQTAELVLVQEIMMFKSYCIDESTYIVLMFKSYFIDVAILSTLLLYQSLPYLLDRYRRVCLESVRSR